MAKSEKQRIHLVRLAELKRGRVSPLKGRKLLPFNEVWRKNMSNAHKGLPSPKKGKRLSQESKEKIRRSKLGKKLTKAHKKAISLGNIKRFDRVGRVKHKRYWRNQDKKLIEWRKKVFERDGYTCQRHGEKGGNLEAHHIKSWVKFPKLRYVVSNGITVCYEGHKEIDPFRK